MGRGAGAPSPEPWLLRAVEAKRSHLVAPSRAPAPRDTACSGEGAPAPRPARRLTSPATRYDAAPGSERAGATGAATGAVPLLPAAPLPPVSWTASGTCTYSSLLLGRAPRMAGGGRIS